MNTEAQLENKIFYNAGRCKAFLEALGGKLVWTNGCFDLLHEGHLHSLILAKTFGEHLVVGLNSDRSVGLLKGADRPVQNESTRSRILASLFYVDAVLVFDGIAPLDELQVIKPDIFAKGAEYNLDDLPEAKYIRTYGGEIRAIPMLDTASSTKIINKIKMNDGDQS